MKSICFILFLSFVSCQEERTYRVYQPEPEINPWEYINRISDTLPETEFSLFNTREENKTTLQIFKKSDLEFKHRISQNKWILIQARDVLSKPGIYCYMPPHPFHIILHENNIFFDIENSIPYTQMDSIKFHFKNHIINETNKPNKINNEKSAYFIVDFNSKISQSVINNILDNIADGYLEAIQEINPNFLSLDIKRQNHLLKNIPLKMVYQFFD